MTERLRPAGLEERARLKAMYDAPMDVAEFVRCAAAPLTAEEIAETRELITWLTRVEWWSSKTASITRLRWLSAGEGAASAPSA